MAMFNHNYGKSQFLMGKSTISMAMFNHNYGNHFFSWVNHYFYGNVQS